MKSPTPPTRDTAVARSWRGEGGRREEKGEGERGKGRGEGEG